MLHFDHKGYLVPDKNIECKFKDFKATFVEMMPHEQRKLLYKGLIKFLQDLMIATNREEILTWINGSFTTKKENPNDIDIVYFLEHSVAQVHEPILFERFSYPETLTAYGVDAYLVKLFPENHLHHLRTQSDKLYWISKFSRTRKNRRGTAFRKGFLEINIRRHEIE